MTKKTLSSLSFQKISDVKGYNSKRRDHREIQAYPGIHVRGGIKKFVH